MNMTKQKLLQPSRTRWLALSQCVERVLNQWNALYTYFAVESCTMANPLFPGMSLEESIFHRMNYPLTKVYLQFFSYILRKSANLNARLQTNDILLHSLYLECADFLLALATNFMQPEVVTRNDLHSVDPYNAQYLSPTDQINIGQNARDIVSEFTSSTEEEKEEKITAFYIKRLPFQDNSIRDLSFLKPKNALQKHKSFGQLDSIFRKFNSKIEEMDVMNEWHKLGRLIEQNEEDDLSELQPLQFWRKIHNEQMVPNISKLANMCLCIPHLNAEIERFFSMVHEVQTFDRNCLHPNTVAAITRTKLHLKTLKKRAWTIQLQSTCGNYSIRQCIRKNISHVIIQDETEDSDSTNTDAE
ncbi:uncharacterized protein LOC113463894 [Ceratina calcarata]|uniref:Uncharacterized protein LOC113463894 n=1 Tax=Ceratina calcarata TaxID=156304 RepID=A0AAJ7W8F3_9HYME|nr:uncharacterized protein LOC113463894 [Ceratina calcarata]